MEARAAVNLLHKVSEISDFQVTSNKTGARIFWRA